MTANKYKLKSLSASHKNKNSRKNSNLCHQAAGDAAEARQVRRIADDDTARAEQERQRISKEYLLLQQQMQRLMFFKFKQSLEIKAEMQRCCIRGEKKTGKRRKKKTRRKTA